MHEGLFGASGDLMAIIEMKPKFNVGNVYATPGAIVALEFNGITALSLLRRHMQGDWGDICEEDRVLNEFAVVNGDRLLSSYTLGDGQVVWIVSYPNDHSVILTPDEY